MKGQLGVTPDIAARETYLRWAVNRNVYRGTSLRNSPPTEHNTYPWLSRKKLVLSKEQVQKALELNRRARIRKDIQQSKARGSIDPSIFYAEDFDDDPPQPPLNAQPPEGLLSVCGAAPTSLMKCSRGKIHMVVGPMFSGKTSWMISHAKSHLLANKRVQLIIPVIGSERYTRKDMASSHDGLRMCALKVKTLEDATEDALQNVDTIGIDEGHFFANLASFCDAQAALGRDVFVAGLKADSDKKGWTSILELFPVADYHTCLTSTCILCGGEATCSKKIVTNANSQAEGNGQIDVGADEKYVATCSECWLQDIPREALEKRTRQVELLKEMTTESN